VNALNDGQRTRFDFPIIAWDGATGRPLPAWPRQLEDMQFFMNPAIADVDGDGQAEVIHGSGGFLLHALSPDGTEPAGWPKLTGQWILGSPTVGDIDGDDLLEVVVGTRQGELFAWDTPAPTWARVDWAGFGHDPAHTRNAETPLVGWNADPPVSDTADTAAPAVDGKPQPGGCGCAGAPRGRSGGAGLLALGLSALLLRRRRG
jgi:MYXO-CTERM domain-containing protein